MQKLEGKWVLVKPWTERTYLGTSDVLFVHKETAKQIRASSSPTDIATCFIRQIPKDAILSVVPESAIGHIRETVRNVSIEYKQKLEELLETHFNKMCSIADDLGEKYEIDNQ